MKLSLQLKNFYWISDSSKLSLPEENELVIKSGDTFYSTLMDYGINSSLINKIANDSELKDFIRLKVNDRIYMKVSDEQVEMKRFSGEDYFIDVLTIIENSYKFTRKRDELEKLTQYREFVITDSLYASGKKSGVPDSVLGDLIYIFGWDIDYAYDIRNGDKVKILYEDIYSKSNGKLIAVGDILAAEFVNRGESISVIRFSQRGRKRLLQH